MNKHGWKVKLIIILNIMSKIITIDGPASAGKGTLSRQLAEQIGANHLDNGAVFRSATLSLIKSGISITDSDSAEIIQLIRRTPLSVKWDGKQCKVYLSGTEVTNDITELEVGRVTSILASDRNYFVALSDLTRRMATQGSFISDGRAVGTFIFPNANLKFFVTASPEVRAQRRYEYLLHQGMIVVYEEVLKDILERDNRDLNREFCPLEIPNDAFIIDTSNVEPGESLNKMLNIVKDNFGEDFMPKVK